MGTILPGRPRRGSGSRRADSADTLGPRRPVPQGPGVAPVGQLAPAARRTDFLSSAGVGEPFSPRSRSPRTRPPPTHAGRTLNRAAQSLGPSRQDAAALGDSHRRPTLPAPPATTLVGPVL
jgi:hypothetical protein